MSVNSKVNPNFPLPGIDQPSKGFRDNFAIIKQEIEALQGKSIQLVGDVTSTPVLLGAGNSVTQIVTQSKNYTTTFTNAQLTGGGVILITHGLAQRIVLVQVSDDQGYVIQPDLIQLLNNNQVQITLGSFLPITGTWNVIVRA
jgi:hypothetical protein